MNATRTKYGIIVALLIVMASLVTCEVTSNSVSNSRAVPDTTLLNQWKAEKVVLVKHYEAKLCALKVVQDSMQQQVTEKKGQLAASQAKTRALQSELQKTFAQHDSSSLVALPALADSLSSSCTEDNTLCDQTIQSLEHELATKDSSIAVAALMSQSLKDELAIQDSEVRALTAQLNVQQKSARRSVIKSKLLAGGFLVLSGVTSSLLLIQTLK